MQITIRRGNNLRTDAASTDFEEILAASFDSFHHRLKKVFVFIDDVNGPRGGVDKQCRCVLHLKRMPPVVIQDQDQCIRTLIHRVANRASYALSQKLDRRSKSVLKGREARRRMKSHFDQELNAATDAGA